MAERGGGKIKIANWEYFDRNWSEKIETVDKNYKADFSKSLGDFRKIMQKAKKEEEKIVEAQTLYRKMRNEPKFQHFPEKFQKEISDLFRDEEKDKSKESAITRKGGDLSQSQRSQVQDPNQSIDEGPAPKKSVPVANPQQSMYSPSQSRKQDGDQEKQDSKALQEKIKALEKELAKKSEEVKNNEHILADRQKHIEELENDGKKKDLKIDKLDQEALHLAQSLEEKTLQWTNVTNDLGLKQKMNEKLEASLNEYASQELVFKNTLDGMKAAYKKLEKEKSQVEKSKQRDLEHMQEVMKDEKRKFDDQYKKLMVERDDLRDRFSKLAGAKLQEKNADIADLSDPNRAMKLSEKFGQIYDDEWTNAFESLTDKKINLPLKHAIALLLRFLQECWSFCNKLMTTQMESLHSVFLHPSQNLASFNPKQIVGGLKDHPRISSKDDKTLFALRRQIGVSPTVIEEVKQALLSESKTWNKEKTGYEKKHVEACAPYLLKCAEICWLMALHDPPLYMKMDVKPGEKLDQNICTVYSSSGNSIDFLVWPPLLNGKDGGLLAKGVAEPQRTVTKKK